MLTFVDEEERDTLLYKYAIHHQWFTAQTQLFIIIFEAQSDLFVSPFYQISAAACVRTHARTHAPTHPPTTLALFM